MTHNLQDKQAFFAAYIESNYYREIKKYTGESNIVGPWKAIERFVSIEDMDSFNKRAYKNIISVNDYLELTPLSSITDKDAIEVAKIVTQCDDMAVFTRDAERMIVEDTKPSGIQVWIWFDGDIFVEISFKEETLAIGSVILQAYDHLRSRGYFLPFRQYTTQQLLDMGWAKLKTKP